MLSSKRSSGKPFYFFGEIELISIKCLSPIPTESVGSTAVRLEFSRRVDLLLEILETRKDAGMDLSASGFDGKDREFVLGRKTYEIFEAYWPPYQPEDDPIARTLNAAKKHVASRTLKSLQWKFFGTWR